MSLRPLSPLWHEGPRQVALCAHPPARGTWEVRVTGVWRALAEHRPRPCCPCRAELVFLERGQLSFPLPFGSGPMSIWCHQDEGPAFGQGPSVQALTVGQLPLHPWTRLQCSMRWGQTVCCTAWRRAARACRLQQLLGFRVTPCRAAPHSPRAHVQSRTGCGHR